MDTPERNPIEQPTQADVTLAFWLLTLDGLKHKGLLQGGPRIDRERLQMLVSNGERLGLHPDRSVTAGRKVFLALGRFAGNQ